MGIRYGQQGQAGSRLYDFKLQYEGRLTRLYDLLSYEKYTLLIFGKLKKQVEIPSFMQLIQFDGESPYENSAVLVRPDSYIHQVVSLNQVQEFLEAFNCYA
jgi:hypothetical protein